MLLFCAAVSDGLTAPLDFEQTIPLPGVTGRIDHMDVDVSGSRLFVAAPAFDAVEVVDLDAGRRSAERRPFHKPQGVRFFPLSKQLFVANGGGGGAVAFADGVSPATRSRLAR